MTRYAKLEGRRKTYLAASGFQSVPSAKRKRTEEEEEEKKEEKVGAQGATTAAASTSAAVVHDNSITGSGGEVKKKKKTHRAGRKLKKSKTEAVGRAVATPTETEPVSAKAGDSEGDEKEEAGGAETAPKKEKSRRKEKSAAKAKAFREKKKKEMQELKDVSEQRRLKRIAQRNSETTCFACRERGHAARDCPVRVAEAEDPLSKDGNGARVPTNSSLVGICFRCGSTSHTLSKCRKPALADGKLPFATCFVCHAKGHLSGQCPQGQGVYPKGGACKLCGEKTHLAKDCELRRENKVGTTLLGSTMLDDSDPSSRLIGADEDDFHAFGRAQAEVEREEREREKAEAKRRKGLKAALGKGAAATVAASPVVENNLGGWPGQTGGGAAKVISF